MESEKIDVGGMNEASMGIILDVKVEVTGLLGDCEMTMREVLELAAGTIVQLKQKVTDPVLLCLNNKPVARGEVVVVNDSFGIKITEMVDD